VHPAAGNWLYYVNGSDDGHLYFTASEEDFGVAKQKCIDNDWGCG
jgi:cell division protein YceG involved in septum cleavage